MSPPFLFLYKHYRLNIEKDHKLIPIIEFMNDLRCLCVGGLGDFFLFFLKVPINNSLEI